MCKMHGHHMDSHGCQCGKSMSHFPPLMSEEEETEALEKYKEALETQLERVNKKLKESKP